MRVLLVNPGCSQGNDFPLGLGLLGSVLIRDGYKVEIINGNIDPYWNRSLLVSLTKGPVLYVGYTAMSTQIGDALRSAKLVKAGFQKVPVVFGGVHPTLAPDSILRHGADAVVVGEGDRSVVPLAEHYGKGFPMSQVPNLAWSGGRTATKCLSTFDDLPDIHPSLYEDCMEKVVLKVKVDGRVMRGFSLLTGLGCNYRCAFCINHVLKRKHRIRSAKSIFREIEYLHDFHGIEFFNFQDEHFTCDKTRLDELLTLLESAPFRIRWNCTARVNDLLKIKEETLVRMREAGITDFGVGGESGSDRVLREVLNKGITRRQILGACKVCNRVRIPINLSFVLYWPGERFWERVQTLWAIFRVYLSGGYCGVPYLQTYRPYPGSKWECDVSKFNDPMHLPQDMLTFTRVTPMILLAKAICFMGRVKNFLQRKI